MGLAAAVLVAVLLGAGSSAMAAASHRCPGHQYWDEIVVRGMTCDQAVAVHREKIRDCVHPQRKVTPTAYVYTCMFGPWTSTERVGRKGFSDRIYIRRGSGRVWLRYAALP